MKRALESIQRDVKNIRRDIENNRNKAQKHREAADALDQSIIKDEELASELEAILEQIKTD